MFYNVPGIYEVHFVSLLQRAGDLRSSFCELAHQDVFRKSHDVAPLGGIMGCNPRHDGPPNGGPSVGICGRS